MSGPGSARRTDPPHPARMAARVPAGARLHAACAQASQARTTSAVNGQSSSAPVAALASTGTRWP